MTFRVGLAAAVLFGAGVAVGCGAGSANNPPPATAASAVADDEPAAGLLEHHRYHHHGGVMLFIAMSLDSLGVSPDQRVAVEKIRSDLHTRMDPVRGAEQSLEATLADGLTASSFDAAKVDAAVAQATTAAAALQDATADALNALHALLTPPQRAALVDKVEAHWAVWQKANAEEAGPTPPEDGHLATLATDLELTGDQVQRISEGLGERMKGVSPLDPPEIAAHLRAFGDAFLGETYDARALTAANGVNAHMVGRGAAHMARFVEAASPILTPDQRAKLAQRLRQHSTHDPSAQGSP